MNDVLALTRKSQRIAHSRCFTFGVHFTANDKYLKIGAITREEKKTYPIAYIL